MAERFIVLAIKKNYLQTWSRKGQKVFNAAPPSNTKCWTNVVLMLGHRLRQ